MKHLFPVFLFAAFGIQASCNKSGKTDEVTRKDSTTTTIPVITDTLPRAGYDLSNLDPCTVFSATPVVNNMQNQSYLELSGVAASRVYAGILFVHEDSGNRNEIYITNSKGEDLGKIVLDGIVNRDWEDIAVGPGPEAGKSYIYVGEIGDNKTQYPSVFVYRFPEPSIPANVSAQTTIHIPAVDKIQLIYPKGAVNAESLLVDPFTKDIFIATKEKDRSTLFVARYPQSTTQITTLIPLALLPFDHLTAGDISPDGSEVLLRNNGQIWYWNREGHEDIAKTILRKPQDAPYARNEPQGEGIGFAADGSGYFTNSEIKDHPSHSSALSFYKRNK